MRYLLNNKVIDVEDGFDYLDFYLENGQPQLVKIKWDQLLALLESDPSQWSDVEELVRHLSRWVNEAPRKRMYRQMILDGFSVLTTEIFFDKHPEGFEIIEALERTGELAARICEAFGTTPMKPLAYDDPTKPIPVAELSKYESK